MSKKIIIEETKELEIVDGGYYQAKSSKKNIQWKIWAIDEDSVALMKDTDGTGKRVSIELFKKNWIKVK